MNPVISTRHAVNQFFQLKPKAGFFFRTFYRITTTNDIPANLNGEVLRMVPSLESAGLFSKYQDLWLHHIQALTDYGHNWAWVHVLLHPWEEWAIFQVNILLLPIFFREPKECHGHHTESLLLEDLDDLAYQASVRPTRWPWRCTGCWLRSRMLVGCGWLWYFSARTETCNLLFFLIKILFWLTVAIFFFPKKNFRVTKTLSLIKLLSGSSKPSSGLGLELGLQTPFL